MNTKGSIPIKFKIWARKNIVGLECWCKPDQMIACCVSKVTPTWQIDVLESQRSCRKSVSPTIFEIEHADTNHFLPYVMRRSDLCGQAQFQKLPLAHQSLGLSGSYSNLDQISSEESRPSVNYKISIKHQHLNLNFKILTKPSFRISTKNNLHNLSQGSAAKYWLNLSAQLQNCAWTSTSILTKPCA